MNILKSPTRWIFYQVNIFTSPTRWNWAKLTTTPDRKLFHPSLQKPLICLGCTQSPHKRKWFTRGARGASDPMSGKLWIASAMIKSCRRRALPAARRSMPNYPEPKFRGPKRTKAPRVISSQNLEPENDFNLCSLSPGWSCTSTLTAACACPPSGRSARTRFATSSPASSEWFFRVWHFLATGPWRRWLLTLRWRPPQISLLSSPASRSGWNPSAEHTLKNRSEFDKLTDLSLQYTAPALTGDMAAIERVS